LIFCVADVPTVSFDTLYHVGTLNIKDKVALNFEGANGLSISTAPNAWRRINKGITKGSTFRFRKSNNTFIDANSIDDSLHQQFIQWGLDNQLLVSCQQYAYKYWDDEIDEELVFYFDDEDDAILEAEGEHDIYLVDTYKGTEKMSLIVGDANKDNLTLVLVAYCCVTKLFDGVFWDCEVDVNRYQAPRGVIIQDKISTWSIDIVV
tara:strand:- start:51 stop:668 length:618 start_codon:yes stop_codon:yes gene_type:complete